MLINVFGEWVNPTNITYIETNFLQTYVYFSGEHEGVEFNNKTPDEVANEINKQIMLQKNLPTTYSKKEHFVNDTLVPTMFYASTDMKLLESYCISSVGYELKIDKDLLESAKNGEKLEEGYEVVIVERCCY